MQVPGTHRDSQNMAHFVTCSFQLQDKHAVSVKMYPTTLLYEHVYSAVACIYYCMYLYKYSAVACIYIYKYSAVACTVFLHIQCSCMYLYIYSAVACIYLYKYSAVACIYTNTVQFHVYIYTYTVQCVMIYLCTCMLF